MQVKPLTTAAAAPTQNSKCERAGGNWKHHARALMDEFSISFDPADSSRLAWMAMTINWAVNSAIDNYGYSAAQWALGRGLRLPYSLQSSKSQLSLHSRLHLDRSFRERVAMTAAAQRSIIALRYHLAASKALLSRARGTATAPTETKYALGDQVFYWRGHNKKKGAWMCRWHGPAVVIGFEGSNLWLQHRGLKVKASSRHTRIAEAEEMIPWASLLEEDRQEGTTQGGGDDDDDQPPRPDG